MPISCPPTKNEGKQERMIEEKAIFKCRGCGEKYFTDMESIDDVSLCKWCNEDEGYENDYL